MIRIQASSEFATPFFLLLSLSLSILFFALRSSSTQPIQHDTDDSLPKTECRPIPNTHPSISLSIAKVIAPHPTAAVVSCIVRVNRRHPHDRCFSLDLLMRFPSAMVCQMLGVQLSCGRRRRLAVALLDQKHTHTHGVFQNKASQSLVCAYVRLITFWEWAHAVMSSRRCRSVCVCRCGIPKT